MVLISLTLFDDNVRLIHIFVIVVWSSDGYFSSFHVCCVPEDISPPLTIFVWDSWGYFSSFYVCCVVEDISPSICVVYLRTYLLHFPYLRYTAEDISPEGSCLWYVIEDITFILFVLCSLGDFYWSLIS